MRSSELPASVGATAVLELARGALLGTFVGDALGMPFEGLAHRELPFEVEMVGARRGRGTYTDDTQMMIAVAESLIDRGRLDEEHLARCFQEAYDPDRGYGAGTRQVFELWATSPASINTLAWPFSGYSKETGLFGWSSETFPIRVRG